jgi:tetratricopeptide (TPR) repeat protein
LKDKYAGDDDALNIIYQAMGEALIEMDLYESAVEVIKEAIDVMGENIDFYWLQLQSYASLDEKEEVIKLADKIQKIDPLTAESWYRLGIAFQEIDDLEKAIDAFEYAHSLDSTSGNNTMSLIYAYEKNGNYNKALEKVKDFINLYPDNYVVFIIASKICAQVEDWKEAIKYIDDAIKLVPAIDSLYLYKSSFFLHLEEYKKAKLALEEGIERTNDPEGDLTKELSQLNEKYPNF